MCTAFVLQAVLHLITVLGTDDADGATLAHPRHQDCHHLQHDVRHLNRRHRLDVGTFTNLPEIPCFYFLIFTILLVGILFFSMVLKQLHKEVGYLGLDVMEGAAQERSCLDDI